MQEKNTMGQQEDWELSEEYYKEETGKKELRLEDFLEAEEAPENQSGLGGANGVVGQLEEMAGRVKQVVELSGAGHPAGAIASMLGMDVQQVRDIMVCVQSFPEDDPLAVARLIVLG